MKKALIVVSCLLVATLGFLVVYDLTVHESRKTEKPVLYLYPQRASYSFTDEAGATVTPDTFIRVFMTIREADANTVVQPQTLAPSPTRSGFTVVEWGGSEQQKSHR